MADITISVYDYAHVSSDLLAAAEEDARRIFRHAGIETAWATCLLKPGKVQSGDWYTVDATHLMMKILPRAISAQARDRNDVLGTAIVDGKGGRYFAYVFYESVQRVGKGRKPGHVLLGDVLAHEIGHLLLGSNSHTVTFRCPASNVREIADLSSPTFCKDYWLVETAFGGKQPADVLEASIVQSGV